MEYVMKRITILFRLLFIIEIILIYNVETINAQTQYAKGDASKGMTEIKSMMIKYLSGKDTVSAYFAEPDGQGPFPALIVIHEWWGLNDWVKKDAEKFADSGYAALAIDLYHGKNTDSPEEARKLSSGVDQEQASTDLKSAYEYLSSRKEVNQNKIGSIGWCMGGGYSLRAAVNLPGIKACNINYGALITDVSTLKKLNGPVLGIFGEKDQNLTPTKVKAFQDSLNQAGIKNKIIIYPGVGHAFMNPNNSGHNEEITEQAWSEIFTFFDNNLKSRDK